MKKPFLSPSSLGLFKDCPRCFYREKVMQIKRPSGPFPSVTRGIDETMKANHDHHRPMRETADMMTELTGSTLYPDQANLATWRNWKSGLKADYPNFTVGGAVDDVIVEDGLTYSPYDYKSRGSEPPEGYAEKYYLHQMDVYALLLRDNGMRPSGKAHLRFVWPIHDPKVDNGLRFKGKFVTITVDPERGLALATKAALCLANPTSPESGAECSFCDFVGKVGGAS